MWLSVTRRFCCGAEHNVPWFRHVGSWDPCDSCPPSHWVVQKLFQCEFGPGMLVLSCCQAHCLALTMAGDGMPDMFLHSFKKNMRVRPLVCLVFSVDTKHKHDITRVYLTCACGCGSNFSGNLTCRMRDRKTSEKEENSSDFLCARKNLHRKKHLSRSDSQNPVWFFNFLSQISHI